MEGDRGDKRTHSILMDKILALVYADKNSWGVPNEGQDYPDLIPKNSPFFYIPSGKYKPIYSDLKIAIEAFFGKNTLFRLSWNKDNISEYK